MDCVTAKIKAMKAKLLTKSDYQALCQCQSVEHFLSQSQKRPSMWEEFRRLQLFICDAEWKKILSPDGDYMSGDYIKSWSFVKRLPSSQNREALSYIKGTEIDLQNILGVYRLKSYYKKAQVYPHIIPICYRLDKNAIKQMAESSGTSEFIVAVRHTCYSNLSFDDLEASTFLNLTKTFSKLEKRYPDSIAGVIGYFFAKKAETKNLTAVMEGLKNQLPPEEILSELRL